MSFATISTVVASFIILGVFLFIILNANYIMDSVSNEPDLYVTCETNLSKEELDSVQKALEDNPEIAEIRMITQKEGLQIIKDEILTDEPELFKTIEEDKDTVVPVKFDVKMVHPENSEAIMEEVSALPGVNKASSPVQVVNFITSAHKWINIISYTLLVILCLIAILIVSNAIRLTVHARRRVIGIMKCVGATNSFIRGPFLVEGTVIGLVGAVISYVATGAIYMSLVGRFSLTDEAPVAAQISFVKLNESIPMNILSFHFDSVHVGIFMGCIFALLGIVMGILGSVISIRKYLDV